jgi:hypothetical protein
MVYTHVLNRDAGDVRSPLDPAILAASRASRAVAALIALSDGIL